MGFAILRNPPLLTLCFIVDNNERSRMIMEGRIVEYAIKAATDCLSEINFTMKLESCIVDPNGDLTRILPIPAMFDSAVVISGLSSMELDFSKSLTFNASAKVLGWYESEEAAAAALMQEEIEKSFTAAINGSETLDIDPRRRF